VQVDQIQWKVVMQMLLELLPGFLKFWLKNENPIDQWNEWIERTDPVSSKLFFKSKSPRTSSANDTCRFVRRTK